MTEELSAGLGVDPAEDRRPRLIAAVGLAAYSTAVTAWCSSEGKDDLHLLVDDALAMVCDGFEGS